jgi:hypothetical protein
MRRISPISWVLIVIGLLLIVVGVIYLTTGPLDLPSFIPGAVDHAKKNLKYDKKYTKRGIAALVVAALAFVGVYYKDLRS